MAQGHTSAKELAARDISYLRECRPQGLLGASESADEWCGGAKEINALRLAAFIFAGLGIALISLIFAGKAVAGNDRHRLSVIFSPLVRVLFFLLAISVIGQSALFIYVIYAAEMAAFKYVHVASLFAVGVGAVIGSASLLKNSVNIFIPKPLVVSAVRLSRDDAADLFRLVEEVGRKANTKSPDEIVVGLAPEFFVTTNPVKPSCESNVVLSGMTLYLSLAMLHVLTKDELSAVIGHELGHFRNQDLEYSLRFQPIYARLAATIKDFDLTDGIAKFPLLPASAVVGICVENFATAERSIRRDRELAADSAGAEVAGARPLASALLKLSFYALAWSQVITQQISMGGRSGRYVERMGESFKDASISLLSSVSWQEVWPRLLAYTTPHPVDSHPPLSVRLKALKIEVGDADVALVVPAAEPAILMIANAPDVDNRLTAEMTNSLRFRTFAF